MRNLENFVACESTELNNVEGGSLALITSLLGGLSGGTTGASSATSGLGSIFGGFVRR
jgi:hypothetical protein